jgi:hypothetical protein
MPKIPSWSEHEQPVKAHCLHYVFERGGYVAFLAGADPHMMVCCNCGEQCHTEHVARSPMGHGEHHPNKTYVPVPWEGECDGSL